MALNRIRLESLHDRIMTAEQAAQLFEDGMVVGSSGFTKAGDSKAVLPALAERAKRDPFKITLMTGASLGHDTDGKLAEAGALSKRMPFQVDRTLRNKINCGEVLFIDQHLSESAELLHNKNLPDIDIAILEVAYVDRDGSIVPTTSVGNSVTFAALSKHVILEINTAVSEEVYGIHDIYQAENYPHRNVIPIVAPWNKIGRKTIALDPNKVIGIVFTNKKDSPADITAPDAKTSAIAKHILEFFENEVRLGHLTDRLLPIQAGIGKVANAVLTGFKDSNFYDLTMFSEVLQDSTFDLIDSGILSFASASSLAVSEECYDRVFGNLQRYK
ncbi:MAG TPA: propionyl-CoA--succinate CoA transferase, partial [Sphingobacterium sp.]|nr:propionyl-CoA--succinate CoA transferase [Sphingobacterium sp.]